MVIVGVDPGTIATGWGVISGSGDRWGRVSSGVIKCRPSDPMGVRLMHIEHELLNVVGGAGDLVAVETQFVGRSPRTALAIGMARAVVLVVAAKWEIDVVEIEATRVKLAVAGHGHAPKDKVADAVRKALRIRRRMDENESDALAVAICAAKECSSERRAA